jgi:methylenetetrahydrofolate--tRNA-(uracil-5-)-methyltransferase
MNVNFGLFPPIDVPELGADGRRIKGKDRAAAKRRATAERALCDLEDWALRFARRISPAAQE